MFELKFWSSQVKKKSGAQQLPAPVDNGSNLDLIIDLVIVFQSTFIAGHKKKLKKKSFKNSKVQLKMQICVNNKCKSASEIKSIHALNNFKKIKTNKTSLGEWNIPLTVPDWLCLQARSLSCPATGSCRPAPRGDWSTWDLGSMSLSMFRSPGTSSSWLAPTSVESWLAD